MALKKITLLFSGEPQNCNLLIKLSCYYICFNHIFYTNIFCRIYYALDMSE